MDYKVKACKFLNQFFSLPAHPFNLQNEGCKTYAEWQFDKGEATISYFLDKANFDTMFKDKVVLDIGCGPAGKTLFYASKGVKKIYGLDILEKYESEAYKLSSEKGLGGRFEFIAGDAANMPFGDCFFDTIIMNDAFEHFTEPAAVLNECSRILKPGGSLYVNFPPYYHPYGSHLSDVIGIPWVHILFSDVTLIKVYKELTERLPDGKERISFRISASDDGKEYFSYINKMTVRKFKKLVSCSPFSVFWYNEIPLRSILRPLAKVPLLKECFVKMVVCILYKVR